MTKHSTSSEQRLASSDPEGHRQAMADGEHDALAERPYFDGYKWTARTASAPAEKLQSLNCDRDPVRWAQEFNQSLNNQNMMSLDEGFLIGWFANAMMCGEDTYRWRMEAAQSATQQSDTAKEKLAAFGAWVLEECRGDNIGNDVDGGSIQDKAESLGLLEWVEVAEACGEVCSCAEYDDFPQKCLRYTVETCAAISAALSSTASKEGK